MAIITTNKNLSSLTITAGETLDIRNGATLTIDSTPSVLPGNISCITSGKLLIKNNSTTTPIRVPLSDMSRDFRFEGNGVMEVRGQMMEIGTGTGSAQSFNFATLYSGVINDITYVEVETAVGSGDYMPWGIVPIDPKYFHIGRTDGGGAQSEFVGTPHEAGRVAFWYDANKTLSFGDNINGWSVPTGCKIRIPNILITNNYATDATLIHAIVSEGTPTGGTFTITITNRATGVVLGTTSAIAFNATAAVIDTAIEAITGANTVTSAGGALPTIVSITWAGSLASTPLALTVNSSVTGGTDPVIYSRENSAGNLTLVDITPSGTLDAENCMFSQKIRIVNDAWSRARLVGVGIGADLFQFNNSNGNIEINKVSFTASPYVAQSTIVGVQNVFGQVSINKYVHTVRKSGANFILSAIPNITKIDNVYVNQYYATAKSVSSRTTINLATLSQNLVINNMVSIGGRILATNLFNTVWNNTKVADNIRSTQDTGSVTSASAIQFVNCTNQTLLNTGMAGIAAPRNYFFTSDINSSNIEVINANLDGRNNTLGLVQPSGKTTKIKNSKISNVRTGPFIDQPSSFTASSIEARKVFNTYATAQSTSGLDVAQDAVYDLVSSGIAEITETFTSVENYVGGNFADVSLTPTKGHITFGPVGRGTGYTPTGSTYTSQTGFVKLETSGDTMELEIPFAMHGITDFQNVAPSIWFDGAGAIASNYVLINEGGITGGTFTITVKDSSGTSLGTTSALAWNASTSTIQTAVRALKASINASTVSGSLTGGLVIGFNTGFVGIAEADGSLLTGGTTPNILYAYGRPRLLTGEGFGANTQVDFALATATGSYTAYQTLTPANLTSAFAGLTGYNAGDGLKMKVKMTAFTNDPYRAFTQLSMPTNINPNLWVLVDSSINFRGLQPTDTVEVRKLSDNSLLYTFTGSGTKDIDVGTNYGTQVYFIRKNSGGVELMRTQATPFTFSIGNLGTFNLFAGAEVQLAESGTVTEINTMVNSINANMALESTSQKIKGNTDLIPATV